MSQTVTVHCEGAYCRTKFEPHSSRTWYSLTDHDPQVGPFAATERRRDFCSWDCVAYFVAGRYSATDLTQKRSYGDCPCGCRVEAAVTR